MDGLAFLLSERVGIDGLFGFFWSSIWMAVVLDLSSHIYMVSATPIEWRSRQEEREEKINSVDLGAF